MIARSVHLSNRKCGIKLQRSERREISSGKELEMRIVDLRKVARPGGARVAATVIWEECDRPTQEVYVECRGPAAEDLAPNPDAFLLACVMPAMEDREGRGQLQ